MLEIALSDEIGGDSDYPWNCDDTSKWLMLRGFKDDLNFLRVDLSMTRQKATSSFRIIQEKVSSGKRLHHYEKSPYFFMAKSTISLAIFTSKTVNVSRRTSGSAVDLTCMASWCSLWRSWGVSPKLSQLNEPELLDKENGVFLFGELNLPLILECILLDVVW